MTNILNYNNIFASLGGNAIEKFKINKNFSKKIISLTLAEIITISSLFGCTNTDKTKYFEGNN